MSRPRPLEVKALVPLVEQDWETPEQLIEELIRKLDEVRAERTSYVAVIQHFGPTGFYSGMGPYPGQKSALAALKKRGIDPSYEKWAVVPIRSAEGQEQHMKQVG